MTQNIFSVTYNKLWIRSLFLGLGVLGVFFGFFVKYSFIEEVSIDILTLIKGSAAATTSAISILVAVSQAKPVGYGYHGNLPKISRFHRL